MKIVRKQHAKETAKHKDENREVRTIREASIMLLLHHPHIVSLKEMVVLDDFYYMFMEYVGGGQLLDYIISHGKLKERHARRFARQILSALGIRSQWIFHSIVHPINATYNQITVIVTQLFIVVSFTGLCLHQEHCL